MILRLISLLIIVAVVVFVISQVILPALNGRPLFSFFRKDYRDAVEGVEGARESRDVSRMRDETVEINTDEILGRVRTVSEARRRLSEIEEDEKDK